MDLKFLEFENWYHQKEKIWNQKGVIIEKTDIETTYGHHYRVELKSENGLANIVLYESNGMYWIDLEGGNYNYDEMFTRGGIEFTAIKDVDALVNDLIEWII